MRINVELFKSPQLLIFLSAQIAFFSVSLSERSLSVSMVLRSAYDHEYHERRSWASAATCINWEKIISMLCALSLFFRFFSWARLKRPDNTNTCAIAIAHMQQTKHWWGREEGKKEKTHEKRENCRTRRLCIGRSFEFLREIFTVQEKKIEFWYRLIGTRNTIRLRRE